MVRGIIRKILVKILIWTEKKPPSKVNSRQKIKMWNKEIHLPEWLIVFINVIFIFSAFVLEVGPQPLKLLGIAIFLTISFGLFILYFNKYLSPIAKDNDAVMLVGLISSASVLIIEIVKSVPTLSPLFIPVSGIVLLSALLLGERAGLMLAIVVSLICGVLYEFKLQYLMYHFFGSFVSVVLSSKIYRRSDITSYGFKIALTNIFLVSALTLLGYLPGHIYTNILWCFGNGFISAIFVLAFLPPLETSFSRITNIKLVELTDFNQPLLKRLMLEAPGTYHHSLTVASIAEQSAASIGANSLLVRVGAFYHDIGKLIKPEYFIENQIAMENPHDFILPSMSGLVVISHVKEGVNLAKEFNLDKPIIDFIQQHHGTSLIYSFYQKAQETVAEAKEDSFRYSGPKPKTRESSILMLADSCEAAVRTIKEPSATRIKEIVEKIVDDKFIDGQLDDAPITLSELHKIAQTAVNVLTGIHHARIEYEHQER